MVELLLNRKKAADSQKISPAINLNKDKDHFEVVRSSMEKIVTGWIDSKRNNLFLSKFIHNGDFYNYVVHIESCKIAWINDKIISSFGRHVIGKKCYEVFHDQRDLCSFCNNSKIKQEEGKPDTWIFYNQKLNKLFYVKDVMYLIEGEAYRFESAIDITDQLAEIKHLADKFNL